jgi:predicted transposase/invertase (TIGR01784 family)
VLQFIETVIVHQFPKCSRAEIQKMLQVTDMRQTRVFQEGREEGRDEANAKIVRRMLKAGKSIAEIAEATGLKRSEVRKYR